MEGVKFIKGKGSHFWESGRKHESFVFLQRNEEVVSPSILAKINST